MFLTSLVALVAASVFAGAMLRPVVERWRHPGMSDPGELALFLEHVAVDVRLGRAAPLADRLQSLAAQVKEPVTRERVLGLCTEAALQAGRLSDAARSEEQREALVPEGEARSAVRLRRIGLAVALGQLARAEELAAPLVAGRDPRLADDARLRLSTAMKEPELRSWVTSTRLDDPEKARRAGLTALRLLGDAGEAERLLASVERSGRPDESLQRSLLDVYARLDRPRDLARVAGPLAESTADEGERARLALLQAGALARAGDTTSALSLLEPLRRSRQFQTRQAARRSRYEVLRLAGRLQAEVATLRDPGERAFVALEVERDYAEATRLYQAASAARPDSLELAEGLREAERRRDLEERRALYAQVLAKDPEDQATRDKLLAVLVALGDEQAARRWIGQMLRGREASPEALIDVALALRRAGLDREAAGYLEKAYAAESDPGKRQQILFSLGDLYAAARQEGDARRLYAALATEGASPEVRERAVARLASMLR